MSNFKLIKCTICNSGAFTTKTFLKHLDDSHRNLTKEQQKKECGKFSYEYKNNNPTTREIIINYLNPIRSIISKDLTNKKIESLLNKNKLEDVKKYLTSNLSSAVKRELFNLGYDDFYEEENYLSQWYYKKFFKPIPMRCK